MITQDQFQNYDRGLRRIFAMPITRSTFREVQRLIYDLSGRDQKNVETILKAFLSGEIPGDIKGNADKNSFKELIDNYSHIIALARDVQDRGEFLSILTSDLIARGGKALFVNQIRRVDGKESMFLLDLGGYLNLVKHYVDRLSDFSSSAEGKDILKTGHPLLQEIKDKLDKILKA